MIHSKIRDYINNPIQKPVFINDIYPDNHLMIYLVDRTSDFIPMLSHSWAYSDLLNDCYVINFWNLKKSNENISDESISNF